MMPEGQKMVCVTDSNWDAYCEYQAYDHQAMDRSNDYMLEKAVSYTHLDVYKRQQQSWLRWRREQCWKKNRRKRPVHRQRPAYRQPSGTNGGKCSFS